MARWRGFKYKADRCFYCWTAVEVLKRRGVYMTVDHVIPRSKGGSSGLHNLVTACERCNNAKSDSLGWYAGCVALEGDGNPARFQKTRKAGNVNVWKELKQNPDSLPKTEAVYAESHPLRALAGAYMPVNNELPPGSISLDLETGSVTEMWRAGPEFIRLTGYGIDRGTIFTMVEPDQLIHDVRAHDGWVIGHNILNFDAILLDKHHGLSILDLAKHDRLIDTKLLAFLADPPYSRMKQGEIEKAYSLQTVGTKYLGEGKMQDVATGSSVLKMLAREFGGFDQIPQDHPQYVAYLKRDVEVTRDLVRVLPMSDYTRREHRICAFAATISMQGFRVDIPLLEERIRLGEEKRMNILTSLQGYGLPGPETSKAPHQTNVGKEAIDTAFRDLGVDLPRTSTGKPALGKDVLLGVIEATQVDEVSDLAEAIMGLNGIRTIYANIQDNLVRDRVHPNINLRQSTGRWSITEPGLTVIGKRDGKVTERAVFLADEGCVLISADLAQVDARAVAGLSQDTEYLKLFETGRDLHAEMAVRLFGTKDKRERAKAAAHGINYGMRAKKLALTTGMDLLEAETVIHNFENSFPRLCAWQNEMRETGEVVGILHNGFGRMMRIEAERAFTQSPALMGQSTARDILMEGVLRLWDMGGEDVIRCIRGVIHDELVLSVPVDDVEEIEQLVVDAMSFPWCPVGGNYEVQIMAGLNKRGTDWAQCYAK